MTEHSTEYRAEPTDPKPTDIAEYRTTTAALELFEEPSATPFERDHHHRPGRRQGGPYRDSPLPAGHWKDHRRPQGPAAGARPMDQRRGQADRRRAAGHREPDRRDDQGGRKAQGRGESGRRARRGGAGFGPPSPDRRDPPPRAGRGEWVTTTIHRHWRTQALSRTPTCWPSGGQTR